MATSSAQPRYDFYQTETVVNVSVFIKQARQEDLVIEIAERSLRVKAHSSLTASEHILVIDPLFATVDPGNSSFKVLSSKIDITLHKAQAGQQWRRLESTGEAVISAATPSYTAPSSTATPNSAPQASRSKSKWDSFNPDADDGETAKADPDINDFFKRIYADANEDTKRAMLKSYQESGGTTLSTDWSKVGKGTVETIAPQGMEARKWET